MAGYLISARKSSRLSKCPLTLHHRPVWEGTSDILPGTNWMVPIILSVWGKRRKKKRKKHTQEERACVELPSAPGKRQSLKQEVIKGQRAAGTHMGAWTLLRTAALHHRITGTCASHSLTAHFIFQQNAIAHRALLSENRNVPSERLHQRNGDSLPLLPSGRARVPPLKAV